MTEQVELEMIKSFAYGMSVNEVVDYYNITVSDAEDFCNQHEKDIQDEQDYLKEMGMI